MTNWLYLRLDPKKFDKGHKKWKLSDAKIYYEQEAEYYGNQIDFSKGVVDEDDRSDGSKLTYHSRPQLTNLLGMPLLQEAQNPDPDANQPVAVPATNTTNAMPYAAGDSLFIHNLSHLSTDPYVIGSLVYTIINSTILHFTIISLGISSSNMKDPATKALFDKITDWRNLAPRPQNWRPLKFRAGVNMLMNGGGDGGGDGGC